MIDEPQRRRQPASAQRISWNADLRPTLTRPPDFEPFWAKTCEELSAVEPHLRRMPVTSKSRPLLELSQLTFRSLGGVEVTGYSIGWQDGEPRPLVVHSHGYGSRCEHPVEMGRSRIQRRRH